MTAPWQGLREDEVHVWRLPRTDTPASSGVARVLARYLGVEPGAVDVRRDDRGKPVLGPTHDTVLRFNVSHGGGLSLVAIARSRAVGVDIELLRSVPAQWALTRAALTVREQQALPVGTRERSYAFLRVWVRKEAILKAAGVGLAVEPSLLELTGTRIVSVPPALGRAGSWALTDISLAGHVGAVATEGSTVPRLRLFA
jgi:4'-phosphopantetheinyl transferase